MKRLGTVAVLGALALLATAHSGAQAASRAPATLRHPARPLAIQRQLVRGAVRNGRTTTAVHRAHSPREPQMESRQRSAHVALAAAHAKRRPGAQLDVDAVGNGRKRTDAGSSSALRLVFRAGPVRAFASAVPVSFINVRRTVPAARYVQFRAPPFFPTSSIA